MYNKIQEGLASLSYFNICSDNKDCQNIPSNKILPNSDTVTYNLKALLNLLNRCNTNCTLKALITFHKTSNINYLLRVLLIYSI